ncbi:MAG: histidine phosphatase family protein [Candidatus Elarobacter sp.]
MRVYLARHGETTWNLEGRYQGRRESALTALGMRQAFSLADAMAQREIGRVIASPMLRCTATAKPAAERMNLRVETDDRLIEIAHGTWEGRLRDEIAANDAERYRAWRTDPAHVAFEGGETIAQVLERWRAFRASLHDGAPALVVTHDAVVRAALIDVAGASLDAFWDWDVENGAYAVLDSNDTGWTLVAQRENAHLEGLRASTEGQAL